MPDELASDAGAVPVAVDLELGPNGEVVAATAEARGMTVGNEIRPTPEPATYGAIFLSACFGLLGWRRFRARRAQ